MSSNIANYPILEILDDNSKYYEDFISRSAYHSNAIEGNTLSFSETYALLFDKNHSKIKNATVKEIYEAINHKYALDLVLKKIRAKDYILDEPFLTELNRLINHNIMYVEGYRLGDVRIIGSEKKFLHPLELEEKMQNFFMKYHKAFEKHVYLKCLAKMHLEFENIHPYPDGNGRTGRLLINYFLLKNGQIPIVIPLEKRAEYLYDMETDNVEELSKLFMHLQELEKNRIHDFIEMGLEEKRQISRHDKAKPMNQHLLGPDC